MADQEQTERDAIAPQAEPEGAAPAPSASIPQIRTPDQRLRVFVSSTLQELATERAAAREAITQLHLAPVLFELGARPHPPRDLYRAYLSQSDIFLGIYWQRYGWVAPGMSISGLEDEYLLSGDKPKLIYVKMPAPERDAGLTTLLDRVRADDRVSYKSFQTPDELRDLIENDLALLLTERFDWTKPSDRAAADGEHRRHSTLPVPRSPLVNRTREVQAARSLLLRDDVGLVTLTGPGGTGKTRLALHVAGSLLNEFAQQVEYVSLAPISDPTLVGPTIAAALDVRETGGQQAVERLLDSLRDKRLLLVLDNFEQVIGAAAFIAQILEACPHLKMLVTSRRPLHVRDEQELPVPSLAVPDKKRTPTPERLSQYAAVQLFIERAREVKPDFAVSNANAPAVAEICSRLDGLPLAIELAAARIKLLPPEALLARLDRRLPLLTRGARDLPERQQTMRGAIEWSYDLLGEPDKRLFRRLAVFVGGCTLEAAASVCGADDLGQEVLDGIESLVDKSLVRTLTGLETEPRVGMLQTIREFALERLEESGESEAIRRHHADYCVALAEEAAPHLTSAARRGWLERLELEHDNLRAALEWSKRADPTMTLRLAGALSWFWFLRGHVSEGRGWLQDALAQTTSSDRTAVRARALYGAGGLAWAQGDSTTARAAIEESVAIFRSLGESRGLAFALTLLGLVLVSQGDPAGARSPYMDSIGTFREVGGDPWGEAFALLCLGEASVQAGDRQAARMFFEESLGDFQELDDHWGRAIVLSSLAWLAQTEGDYGVARALNAESIALFRETGDKWDLARALISSEGVALHEGDPMQAEAQAWESLALGQELGDKHVVLMSLGRLAGTALARGESARATRLLGAVDALTRTLSYLNPRDRATVESHIAEARAALGQPAFAAAWAAGQAMTLDQAIAYALEQAPLPPSEPSVAEPTATG